MRVDILEQCKSTHVTHVNNNVIRGIQKTLMRLCEEETICINYDNEQVINQFIKNIFF